MTSTSAKPAERESRSTSRGKRGHQINGGPSVEAKAAYMNEAGAPPFPLFAAHQPSLGLDRSVCLRDVVEFIRGRYSPRPDDLASAVENEFTG